MPPKSPKSPKPAAGNKKGKVKDPKKLAGDLAKQNADLTTELEAVKAELESKKNTLLQLAKPLMENMKKKWKTLHEITDDMDMSTIKGEHLKEAFDLMIVKKREHEESVEVQVAVLECRVTEMSLELMRLGKKCRAYEMAMGDLLHYDCLNAVKDRVYQLQVIAGEAYHSAEANDLSKNPEEIFMVEGITDRNGCDARRDINAVNALNLQPPVLKYPGDTLLKDIFPDLGIYIMQELNIEKYSGADWRTLANRVGIEQEKLEEWSALRLKNPAGRVLTTWIDACPAATVRLLHRHLMSPPMRCTLLCKRLSDFYSVN